MQAPRTATPDGSARRSWHRSPSRACSPTDCARCSGANAPFRVPPRSLVASAPFLLRFASCCTDARFRRGLVALEALAPLAFAAYDELRDGGVAEPVVESPIVAAFEDRRAAGGFEHELELLAGTAMKPVVRVLSGEELLEEVPLLSRRAGHGFRIEQQRFLQPARYMAALAAAVAGRGGRVRRGEAVTAVEPAPGEVALRGLGGGETFDAVVLAAGAWLSRLGRRVGVRLPLAAGRGYSVSVESDIPLEHPLYLPASRVACSPDMGRVRLAGTMEIAPPDAPLDRRRIDAVLASSRALLSDAVHLDRSSGHWVGPRPVTADGLPLIGVSAHPRVFVGGGHGMWGVTLGPATGRLLADLVLTGNGPPALAAFDPCR